MWSQEAIAAFCTAQDLKTFVYASEHQSRVQITKKQSTVTNESSHKNKTAGHVQCSQPQKLWSSPCATGSPLTIGHKHMKELNQRLQLTSKQEQGRHNMNT